MEYNQNRDLRGRETAGISRSGKLVIRKTTVLMCVLWGLMILPDDFFRIFPVYQSLTPSDIDYTWLKYNFGAIQLILLAVGVFYALKLNKRWLFAVIAAMLLRELVYLITGQNSIFKASAYEMYLTFFVGYGFLLWVEGGLKTRERCETFFKWFMITNVLTLYMNVAMGGVSGRLAVRYHASNLSVGGTGTLCSVCVLYLGLSPRKKWYDYAVIVLSVIGLYLSGSRANFVFLVVILAMYIFLNKVSRRKLKHTATRRKSLLWLLTALLLLAAIFYIAMNFSYFENWLLGGRFAFLKNLTDVKSERSVSGRMLSLTAGLDVLAGHPFGLSGYFVNLQREVVLRGFPTFPHSTLLSMYLFFGPVVLILYGIWISMLKKLKRRGSPYFYILTYLLISTVIYGGPISNFKLIFIYGILTLLPMWEIRGKRGI